MSPAAERLPKLSHWSATRQSLHLYSRFLGAVCKALAEPHPRWWQISLEVDSAGLGTSELALPGGGPTFSLVLDLKEHRLRLDHGGRSSTVGDLRGAPTGKALGEAALEALGEIGQPIQIDRERWADDHPRVYVADDAASYRRALAASDALLRSFRADLSGERGPVQLWPHHFDLSFEWLLEKRVSSQGQSGESRAQIGFGFSAGDDDHPEAYYYANPWPFDAAWTRAELPQGARWLTEPWQGTLLPYEAVTGGDGAAVRELFQAVFDTAAPDLED